MEETKESYNRLIPEWMFDYMEKIDMQSMKKLHEHDAEYLKMEHDRKELEQRYPFVADVIEDDTGAVSLTEEQHKILYGYIELRRKMQMSESQMYYMTGHKHCFEYLCKIDAIKPIP